MHEVRKTVGQAGAEGVALVWRVSAGEGALDHGVVRADENPVAVYIARLTSKASRRTMLAALDRAAAILSGAYDPADERVLDMY